MAQTQSGRLISLASYPSREWLKKKRETAPFYCPICKEKVQLKIGEKNAPHFAHRRRLLCEGDFEGESAYHALGKKQLFFSMMKAEDVQLEPYLETIKQRPDLLVRTPDGIYPIEFQCANIPASLLAKRTDAYQTAGCQPIWIVGAKHVKRLSVFRYEFSSFEWNFLRLTEGSSAPYFLYYSPAQQQLLQLQHIYPFSAKTAFASLTAIPLHHLSFQHFFPEDRKSFPPLLEEWNRYKRKWRLSYMLYKNKSIFPFLKMLYENKVPPSHFPAEAGLPHPLLYGIKTPACIWQSWILFDVFVKRRVGSMIFWKEITFYFLKRIRQGIISLRPLTLCAQPDPLFILRHYINQLCRLHLVKEVEKDKYQLLRHPVIPELSKDIFQEDIQLLAKLEQIE